MKFINLMIILAFFCCPLFAGESVEFWKRGDVSYLCQNMDMPIWPVLPEDSIGLDEDIVMTIKMPRGFKITGYGESKRFAMQPKPLMIPKNVLNESVNGEVLATVTFPSLPAEETSDSLKYAKGKEKMHRGALLINPGDAESKWYPIEIGLKSKSGQKQWDILKARVFVYPELKAERPERMRVEAFDYADYENPVFKEAIKEAVVGSGINVLTNMRIFEDEDSLAQTLREDGVKASVILFWHNLIPEIGRRYSQAYPLNKDGERITKADFLLKNNICHTWCINNPDKVKEVIKNYFKEKIVGRFDSVTNDNEEKALARDGSYICGDVYTPITIDAFKEFASIDESEELSPEIIVKKYSQKWVDFRCWQSSQMSMLLSEALFEVDPSIEYGYYSGNKYVGELAGFTKNMYATDWEVLSENGGIYFGSSGYYGSTDDYAATTEALGDIPHIPAEMYIENFIDEARDMPDPERYRYRLMNSLMYGSGGFAVWYLQVLDGGAYHAIAEVASIAAEIEDYILDGEKCNDELVLAPNIDPKSVFAYKLGQKRVVVFINHSSKTKTIRYGWKKAIRKPDTVETVSGKKFADASMISMKIKPKDYAVFITLSQGN